MTIRIRETRGASWPGPRPGTRQWASTSVTYPAWFLALAAPFRLMWLALLIELWLAAESVLLPVTAALAAAAVVRGEARWGQVGMTRLRWRLWMVDVR